MSFSDRRRRRRDGGEEIGIEEKYIVYGVIDKAILRPDALPVAINGKYTHWSSLLLQSPTES